MDSPRQQLLVVNYYLVVMLVIIDFDYLTEDLPMDLIQILESYCFRLHPHLQTDSLLFTDLHFHYCLH